MEFRTGVYWANPVFRYFSQEERVYHRKVAFFPLCFPLSPAGVECFKLIWMWSLGTEGPLLQPLGALEDASPKLCGNSSGAITEFEGSGQFQTKKLNTQNMHSSVLTQRSLLRQQGAQKKSQPSLQFSMPLLQFSYGNLGSCWWMVYLSHQLHSTFMVIVFYRLIDFYILSKSGSYTTWFII